jgi:hypothetical protein
VKLGLEMEKELERWWSSRNFSTGVIEQGYCCFEQNFEEKQKVD